MEKFLKMFGFCLAGLFLFGAVSYGETVKIIAEDDWYPYSASIDGGAKGIAVDIVSAVYKAEGIDVEFQPMNYDRGMALVKDGSAVGCFDTSRTKELEQDYLWHDEPMFAATSMFYASADSTGNVNSVNDLAGKTLGLTQGYSYGDKIDLNKGIDKEYSKSDEVILKKLVAKRVDYVIVFEKVADSLVTKLNLQGKIRPAGKSETTMIYVSFSKTHPQGKKYCDLFSEGFRKIKADGTYQKLMDQWDAKLKGAAPEPVSK
ncbi:MAG: transporter substrate-binding domain-containing protein [Candidatus Omnitrophica bacterium]|nr:transporter substrate-binding domain-containing protein [Candidatus Omnitrophota bacterium]